MSLEYHRRELTIALDPSNRARAMPLVLPAKHRRILDVGCGMGQTLLAAQLPGEVEAYGIDRDLEAIEAGSRLAPANIKLVCANGENIPFQNGYFDLVISRIAIPYMDINKALREIARVLRVGGEFWLTLHPVSKVFSRAKHSALGGDLSDVLVCSYVLLNGTLFHCFGIQIPVLRRKETFQTASGIARAAKRAGLACSPVRPSTHFIMEGLKPFPESERAA